MLRNSPQLKSGTLKPQSVKVEVAASGQMIQNQVQCHCALSLHQRTAYTILFSWIFIINMVIQVLERYSYNICLLPQGRKQNSFSQTSPEARAWACDKSTIKGMLLYHINVRKWCLWNPFSGKDGVWLLGSSVKFEGAAKLSNSSSSEAAVAGLCLSCPRLESGHCSWMHNP